MDKGKVYNLKHTLNKYENAHWWNNSQCPMTSLICNGKLSLLFGSWRVVGLVFFWGHLFLREISRRWYLRSSPRITLPAYIFHTIKPISKHCDFKRISLAPSTRASCINEKNFKQYTTKNNVSSIIFYAGGCSVSLNAIRIDLLFLLTQRKSSQEKKTLGANVEWNKVCVYYYIKLKVKKVQSKHCTA